MFMKAIKQICSKKSHLFTYHNSLVKFCKIKMRFGVSVKTHIRMCDSLLNSLH